MTPLLAQRPSRADRAFERLYQKHVHAVYRYALAVLHNQADAEDVTQITFLSAYRAFTRGERPELPHNWLIKIAHNVCRQRFRDSQRRPQEVAFSVEETHAAPAPDEEVPTAEEIRNALGFLNFNQRAALVMRELEGRSYAEISEVLDLSISAVETLLFRARRALREQLEGGLTCEQTEITLSQLNEGSLASSERGRLRAHLRECKDCASLERRSRAQRAALKSLSAAPLPASLSSFLGTGAAGGGFALGGVGLGAKAAAVLAAGVVSAGVGHQIMDATAGSQKATKSTQPALLHGRHFSPVSALTGGREGANPIAEHTVASSDLVDTRPEKRGQTRLADSSGRRGLNDGESAEAGSQPGEGAAASTSAPGRPLSAATRNAVDSIPVQLPRIPRVPLPPPPPVALPSIPKLPPVPPAPPAPPVPPVPPAPPVPPVPPVPPILPPPPPPGP